MRLVSMKRSVALRVSILHQRSSRNCVNRFLRLNTIRKINATEKQETDESLKSSTTNPPIEQSIEVTPETRRGKRGTQPSAISLDLIRGRTAEDWLVMATFLKILQFSSPVGFSLIFMTTFACIMLYTIKLIIKGKLYEKRFFPQIWFVVCACLLLFMSIFNV